MHILMDRRSFFKYSAGAVVGASLLGRTTQAFARDESSYSVVILGDTHYDAPDPEKYHAGYTDPNPEREANHRKEFVRNADMWEARCPALVKRAARLVSDDTRFVLQMGDLIQGDTATAAIHAAFLADAYDLLKKEVSPKRNFITVTGNHDVRGNDDAVAAQAYRDYMTARLSKEMGKRMQDTNFLFPAGDDSYLVIDFTHPDVERIEQLLAESEGARHTFIVVHCPVFPYDSAVLCGHTHKTELLDWYGDGGRITQMTMSSVWAKESQGTWTEKVSSPEGYGSLMLKGHPELGDPGPVQDLFNEYRPGVQRYSWADAAGSYKLLVSPKEVYVDFYAGDSELLSNRFQLR